MNGNNLRSGLEEELVNADETNDVTSRHVIDGVNLAAHHEDGTLDSLDEEIVLLARDVVGTLDTDLEAGADSTGCIDERCQQSHSFSWS